MAKNLTDLTARTATADSDLIHVNSGGTDYKETKSDFLKGDFAHQFSNTTLLTAQADTFPDGSTVMGKCYAYGHQTETGSPINAPLYITVKSYDNNARMIEVVSVGDADNSSYRLYKYGGTWGTTWIQQPYRSELTTLSTNLANAKLHYADHYFSNISVGSALYVDLGVIESVFNIPAGSYIVSPFIRGWSGNPGALSLAVSSNGTHLYLMCSATGTVSSVTIRVWYCATN